MLENNMEWWTQSNSKKPRMCRIKYHNVQQTGVKFHGNQTWLPRRGHQSVTGDGWVFADCQEVSTKTISDTLRSVYFSVLEKAGVVKAPEGGFQVSEFVNTSAAKLI
ncbi:hypothetical protein P691DRAFT_782114 [Macrolepiota fuliginosa MF-IS2]|uniref:Uncharacterized protein n=1 Tax=Macrolepiota fuliginosa MF-IS2 TaxID=1400762 RepID=A0A9P5XD54_9AGAR|nr:hypothetical protein P691DRAFT_782114 [Macrolepiota fuliginosa MF-IS2]